jgi:hypothetical protein
MEYNGVIEELGIVNDGKELLSKERQVRWWQVTTSVQNYDTVFCLGSLMRTPLSSICARFACGTNDHIVLLFVGYI